MHSQLVAGLRIETVKPEKDRNWLVKWRSGGHRDEAWAHLQPQWGVLGHIRGQVDANRLFGEGLPSIYEVEHEDKSTSWYVADEIRPCRESEDYTPEERAGMLARMDSAISAFYRNAASAGCHTLIEFTGLMVDYFNACTAAHHRGEQFAFASTHSGKSLPFDPHQFEYMAEKLDCIYGPSLRSDANRKAFIRALFKGEFKLVPSHVHSVEEKART